MKYINIRGVDCCFYEDTETGVVQLVPPFGPYSEVTGIYNTKILSARNEAIKALMRRAATEWNGIERFNV